MQRKTTQNRHKVTKLLNLHFCHLLSGRSLASVFPVDSTFRSLYCICDPCARLSNIVTTTQIVAINPN